MSKENLKTVLYYSVFGNIIGLGVYINKIKENE